MKRLINFDHSQKSFSKAIGYSSIEELQEALFNATGELEEDLSLVLGLATIVLNPDSENIMAILAMLYSVTDEKILDKPSKFIEHIYLKCDSDSKQLAMKKIIAVFYKMILGLDLEELKDKIEKQTKFTTSSKVSIKDLQEEFMKQNKGNSDE